MNRPPYSQTRYSSASQRFLKPAIQNFFAREFPRLFGPIMREKLAEQLLRLIEALHPSSKRLQPGQVLWNALDKHTRSTSQNRAFVPVVLSLITLQDVETLAKGVPMSTVTRSALARIFREAFEQGGLLSTRDAALLTLRDPSTVSYLRIQYEKENNCQLPHTGLLHDIGSGISHKAIALRKILIEKKDPADVAREICHSQKAVDRYLYDYNRVKTAYEYNQNIEYVHLVTGLSQHLIKQYLKIIVDVQNESK